MAKGEDRHCSIIRYVDDATNSYLYPGVCGSCEAPEWLSVTMSGDEGALTLTPGPGVSSSPPHTALMSS